jgi:hypothetical protein
VLGNVDVEATSWACARALAKLEDDDAVPVSEDEVPVTEEEVAAATEGSNAV